MEDYIKIEKIGEGKIIYSEHECKRMPANSPMWIMSVSSKTTFILTARLADVLKFYVNGEMNWNRGKQDVFLEHFAPGSNKVQKAQNLWQIIHVHYKLLV